MQNFTSILGVGLEIVAGLVVVRVVAPIAVGASGVTLAFGTGLQNDSGTLKTEDSEIIHDDLSGFVAAEHYDWTNETHDLLTAGFGTFSYVNCTSESDGLQVGGESVVRVKSSIECIFIGLSDQLNYANVTGIRNICISATTTQWSALTSGEQNIAVGSGALRSLTTGTKNVGIAVEAGNDITSGSSNVCIGNNAGNGIGTAVGNVCIGLSSGGSLATDSAYNTLVGPTAGLNLDASYGTAIGYGALGSGSDVTGGHLVAVGSFAGNNIVTGSNNTIVGYNADAAATNSANATAIGETAVCATGGIALGRGAVAATNEFAIASTITSVDFGAAALTCGSATIGDGTNKLAVAADGELTLHGTARVTRDLWVNAAGMKAPGAKPATAIAHGALETPAWRFGNEGVEANEETVSFDLKPPPDMDRSVAPEFCVGWSTTTTDPGDDSEQVEWQLEYRYTQPGEDTTAAAEETLYATGSASTVAEGLVATPVTGVNLPHASDMCLHCRLKRLSSASAGDQADTVADDVELHGLVFTYTVNKLGTAT